MSRAREIGHDRGRDGELELAGRTQTELVAEHLSGSQVVTAFNTDVTASRGQTVVGMWVDR
jgi:predicted dinucleotide-binding enzyme